ncbi:response regulator transcription factor [Amycolatopsis sp. BJA-103]|uniref:response regulator transcription factor n=2 Tax=unclassified Amycolatopsis TaxID=2618356 RepID=UPI00157FABFA|nr:LuxR C-terminal-related transcriptional regulator [Amycolatopsis sp. BJA-103]
MGLAEVLVEQTIRVTVEALDSLTQMGMVAYLERLSGVRVLPRNRASEVDVVVAAFDHLSADVVAALRRVASEIGRPVVLIIDDLKDDELLLAVECRVVAVLPRTAIWDDMLPRIVRTAATGGAALPPDRLGELFAHVERLWQLVPDRRGLRPTELTTREIEVLRLIAEGRETAEIADKLCYSERTVKNIIYGITRRLNFRNRSHAVASALRAGII